MQTVETAHLIPREQLAHSPFQKTRVSNRGNLEELAASMREVGVLEPLIVRPAPAGAPEGITHELVAGHRRDLAAEIAGLPAVPCLVRDYSDDQVLEVIAVENGQRSDLHPLDESDVFAQLVARGRTPAQVADKVGRQASYVAQRLKLAELCEKGRKALMAPCEHRWSLPFPALTYVEVPEPRFRHLAPKQAERAFLEACDALGVK
jgi:ParB family chromosome partitioning protein